MRKSTLKISNQQTTNTITGAEYLINCFIESGIDTVFGYPGAPILPIYDVLSQTKKVKHYLTRHEQGAIHAAEGYAKVKNKCGVVLVTSGPGFSNVVTGLANAYLDNTPLVVVTGQVETRNQNEFQDIDILSIAKSCSKACYEIDTPDDIEKIFKQAMSDAMKIPAGPVVVAVKNSVLTGVVQNSSEYKVKQEIKVGAPHSYVRELLKSSKDAKSPVILVGGGAKSARQEVLEFAKISHIPVVSTMMGVGCVDEISLGMIGINGDEELNKKIENADVVIAVGVRFTNRTTCGKSGFLKRSKIYNINIEPCSSQNVKIEKNLVGEADVILQHIIGTIKAYNVLFNTNYRWIESLSRVSDEIVEDKFSVDVVLNTIYEYTKRYYPIITTDVGLHQVACAKVFKTADANHFLTSGGFGTMGFGLPAAIGAQIANPNSLVMNITGDGSFQMNMQELGAIMEYNIPIKIFVMNNSSLGMISEAQKENYDIAFQSDLLNPNFSRIASAYGILGYKVTSQQQLEGVLKEIFICKKAVLVEVVV